MPPQKSVERERVFRLFYTHSLDYLRDEKMFSNQYSLPRMKWVWRIRSVVRQKNDALPEDQSLFIASGSSQPSVITASRDPVHASDLYNACTYVCTHSLTHYK